MVGGVCFFLLRFDIDTVRVGFEISRSLKLVTDSSVSHMKAFLLEACSINTIILELQKSPLLLP